MLPGLLFGVLSACVCVVKAEAPLTYKQMLHMPRLSGDIDVWHELTFVQLLNLPMSRTAFASLSQQVSWDCFFEIV